MVLVVVRQGAGLLEHWPKTAKEKLISDFRQSRGLIELANLQPNWKKQLTLFLGAMKR